MCAVAVLEFGVDKLQCNMVSAVVCAGLIITHQDASGYCRLDGHVCVLSAQLFKLMGDDVSPTHFANDSKWAHVLPKSDTTHVRPYQHINSSC